MGKIHNFHKIKFKPFRVQKGSLAAGNFYKDLSGKKQPFQQHLKGPKFSYFEIVKEEPNPYFGKYEEYLENGYRESFGGEFIEKIDGSSSISRSCFLNETVSYVLAYWDNLDHDERTPDLKFVGSRPFDLTKDEQAVFMDLAAICQEEIEEQLNNFNEDYY